MSDKCDNPSCQIELYDFNRQFYEAPNYEKILYGYSKMEKVLKHISKLEEQNSSIQEKTNQLVEHSKNIYEELKANLQMAEKYREEEKRKFKLKIKGLELMTEGKVLQAGKILKALEKEKKETYGQECEEPQKAAKTPSRTSQRIKK